MLIITGNKKSTGADNYICKHNMYIFADENYDTWDYKDTYIIFKGYCFDEDGNGIAINKDSFLPEVLDRLPEFSGFFVLITISKDKTVIYKSLSRNTDVFYCVDDNNLTISDNIKLLSELLGKKTIDPKFFSSFVNNAWVAVFLSPISGIEKINGGCKYVFDSAGVHVFKHANLTPTNKDFIEVTSDMIKSVCKNKKVFLHLSGGFDSTFIFYILKKQIFSLKSIHMRLTDMIMILKLIELRNYVLKTMFHLGWYPGSRTFLKVIRRLVSLRMLM